MLRIIRHLRTATVALAGLLLTASQAYASGGLKDAFAARTPGSTVVVNHAAWDALLKAYVEPGSDGLNRVRYAAFKSDGHAKLKAYVAHLEGVDVGKLDRAEQFAFWANLYNAKTVDIVLDTYPVASIRDIKLGGSLSALVKGGPWQAKVTKVGGHDLSLDDIEHVILRGVFKDPRVHYAVNCASVGCPNLLNEAFTGVLLDVQLNAAARQFVNSPRGARFEGSGVVLSSLYTWFQKDFGPNEPAVIRHLATYAEADLKRKLEGKGLVVSYAYDWRLNDSGVLMDIAAGQR